MNQDTFEKTQFEQVRTSVISYAISSYGKQRVRATQPSSNLALVKNRLQETKEAKSLLLAHLHMPFMGLESIEHLTNQVKKGFSLSPTELVEYGDFLRSGRLIQKFMEKNQSIAPLLAAYSQGINTFEEVENTIYQTIKNNQVSSDASRELRKTRRAIMECESAIEDTLGKFLRHPTNKTKIQEFMIVKKNDRFTVPIKSSYKNQIMGSVIDESSRGTTVFIEPQGVTKLNDKLSTLKMEESVEIYQILASLTGMIAEQMEAIQLTIDIVAEFDAMFARAKYSRNIGGVEPLLNRDGVLKFINVKHVLLGDEAVPLNLELGETHQGLTITGPNAGGKTVVLKTIALTCLQTMIGLQIIADEGTTIPLFDQLFVDIGDNQSIENALSTFSGHLGNISQIIKEVKPNSLVLLDEIGSGTEPNEGAALAIAIMESLYHGGSTVVTTTHYGEIKRYSNLHPGFTTAAMAFDSESLSPLYQLIMGETGESNAFWIANKMKLSPAIVTKAQLYLEERSYGVDLRQEKKKEPMEKITIVKSEQIELSKGDRVIYLESDTVALVFETYETNDDVRIYMDKDFLVVPRKRLKLVAKAKNLYPDNYDLAQLFSDYNVRKEERDLNRGSKKAQKKLQKEMRARRVAGK